MSMTAWLLMVTVGTTNYAVPGIASESDCEALASRMSLVVTQTPKHKCIDYKIAMRESSINNYTLPFKTN